MTTPVDATGFVAVAQVGDIPDGEARLVEIGGRRIGLFHCQDQFFAVGDVCTHAEALLHEGGVDRVRCTVECPLHGSEFDLRSGRVLTPPAVEPVETFAVRLVGGTIEIALPGKE